MELRIVLLCQRDDQELVRPVRTTLVVGAIRKNRVFCPTESAVTRWANQSAHICQPVSGAPEPESTLAEKQILASSLRPRISKRRQRATNRNWRTTGHLRRCRAGIRLLFEG